MSCIFKQCAFVKMENDPIKNKVNKYIAEWFSLNENHSAFSISGRDLIEWEAALMCSSTLRLSNYFLLRGKSHTVSFSIQTILFSLLHIMLSLKFTVIFYQLIESDGTVAVQIHTGIQYMVPTLNQRPEIRRGICVDMTVDHVSSLSIPDDLH